MFLPADTQGWSFFRLLESTAQPFVAVDLDLRFVMLNPAFARADRLLVTMSCSRMTVADITPDEAGESPRASGPWTSSSRTGQSVRYEKGISAQGRLDR